MDFNMWCHSLLECFLWEVSCYSYHFLLCGLSRDLKVSRFLTQLSLRLFTWLSLRLFTCLLFSSFWSYVIFFVFISIGVCSPFLICKLLSLIKLVIFGQYLFKYFSCPMLLGSWFCYLLPHPTLPPWDSKSKYMYSKLLKISFKGYWDLILLFSFFPSLFQLR